MPSFFMRFTSSGGTVVPRLVEGLRDTMGEVKVYSKERAGLTLYLDPSCTDPAALELIVTMNGALAQIYGSDGIVGIFRGPSIQMPDLRGQ